MTESCALWVVGSTMIAWAKALGKSDVADILQKNLEQEYAADQRLSALAESALNRQTA